MDSQGPIRLSRDELSRKHRREVFRQIGVPLAVAAILLVALTALAAFAAGPDGRSAAASWLAILCMAPVTLAAMAMAMFLAGLAWVIGRAKSVSDLMAGVQKAMGTVGSVAESVSRRAARGAMAWESRFAYLDRVISRILGGRETPDG